MNMEREELEQDVDDSDAHWHHQLETEQQRNTIMAENLNGMNFNDLVPKVSQYLSKEDVGEDGVVLTIRGFKREAVKGDDGEEEKIILYFKEPAFADGGIIKPMILNRTNSQLIGVCTGAATAGEAIGKQIVVYNDPTVGFGGKITGGLRIKKVSGAPKAAANAPQDFNDPIPF